MAVKLVKTFYGYVYTESSPEDAVKILEHIRRSWGRDTEDLNDAIRIIKNFDTFYEMLRKKFKEYIAPRKSEADLIRGKVVVDKIKLSKKGGEKVVVIVFDKRVVDESLEEVLKELNLEFVKEFT